MKIYYTINDKLFMDNYLLRENLGLSKSELQQLMNTYHFPEDEIFTIQNKKLYSLDGMNNYLEMILEINGK
jgi:hypothetical protein